MDNFLLRFLVLSSVVTSVSTSQCSERCDRLHKRTMDRINLDDSMVTALFEKQRPLGTLKDVCWRMYDFLDCMKRCPTDKKHEKRARDVKFKCHDVLGEQEEKLTCISRYHSFIEVRCSSFISEAVRLRSSKDLNMTPDRETCRYLHLNSLCLENNVNNYCPKGKKYFRRLHLRDYFLNFIIPKQDDLFDDEDLDSCQIYDFVKNAKSFTEEDVEEELTTLINRWEDEGFSTSSPMTSPPITRDVITLSPSTEKKKFAQLINDLLSSDDVTESEDDVITTTGLDDVTSGNMLVYDVTSVTVNPDQMTSEYPGDDDVIDDVESTSSTDNTDIVDSHNSVSDDVTIGNHATPDDSTQAVANDVMVETSDTSDDVIEGRTDHTEEVIETTSADKQVNNNNNNNNKTDLFANDIIGETDSLYDDVSFEDSTEMNDVTPTSEEVASIDTPESSVHMTSSMFDQPLTVLPPSDVSPKFKSTTERIIVSRNDLETSLKTRPPMKTSTSYPDVHQKNKATTTTMTKTTTTTTTTMTKTTTTMPSSTQTTSAEEDYEIVIPTIRTTTNRQIFSEDSMEDVPPNFGYSSQRAAHWTNKYREEVVTPVAVDTSTLFGDEVSSVEMEQMDEDYDTSTAIGTMRAGKIGEVENTRKKEETTVTPLLKSAHVIRKPIMSKHEMDTDRDARFSDLVHRSSPIEDQMYDDFEDMEDEEELSDDDDSQLESSTVEQSETSTIMNIKKQFDADPLLFIYAILFSIFLSSILILICCCCCKKSATSTYTVNKR